MDRCIYHDGLMGSTDGARSQNPGGKHHSALAIIVIIIVVVDNVVAPECLRYTAPGGEPLCNLAVMCVGSRRLPGTSARVAVLSAPFSSTHRRRVTLGQRLLWVVRARERLSWLREHRKRTAVADGKPADDPGSRLLPAYRACRVTKRPPPGR